MQVNDQTAMIQLRRHLPPAWHSTLQSEKCAKIIPKMQSRKCNCETLDPDDQNLGPPSLGHDKDDRFSLHSDLLLFVTSRSSRPMWHKITKSLDVESRPGVDDVHVQVVPPWSKVANGDRALFCISKVMLLGTCVSCFSSSWKWKMNNVWKLAHAKIFGGKK